MRWQGRRQSDNINDMRGQTGGGFGGGMGGLGGGMGRGGPFVVRRAGGGGIGIIIVILIVSYFLGINPLDLLSGNVSTGPGSSQPGQQMQSRTNDEARAFVATVLADTEDTWTSVFVASGKTYPKPTLTLFTDRIASGCGSASAATGPFYCPNDQNVYIDLGFFSELQQRFGAPGDFAEAYVIAHEVGHHVQNVLGILPEVHQKQAQLDEGGANALSVRTELQADCFAGVWANHTQQEGLLEAGDIDEALTAAAAVGDDKLQREGQGYVVPDSFTHGTSEQRATWFRRGFDKGDIKACDTFSGDV
jgi:predicted metalloprotease